MDTTDGTTTTLDTTAGNAPGDGIGTTALPRPRETAEDPRTGPGHDPRLDWSTGDTPAAPRLTARRDGILPNIAAALTLHGSTAPALTGTAARGEQPPGLHPLVQEYLDALPAASRDRFTGRCAEVLLLSRHLTTADNSRSKRAARKPMTNSEARKSLRNARLTTRHLREDGDPLHGTPAEPCSACASLAAHFGVHLDASP